MKKDKKSIKNLLKREKQKGDIRWIVLIVILAFCISVLFSLISEYTLSKTGLILSLVILLVFIFIGVLFDVIGVAVTSADDAPFHSMASRKIESARTAIFLKRNASKVSSICCDVVGDICGIISGSAGIFIAAIIINNTSIDPIIVTLLITGIISSLTIGGKALSKSYAINNSNFILNIFSKVIHIFIKQK